MKCDLFMVDKRGDLFCSNPPQRMKPVGNVESVPSGLTEGQIRQIEAWKILAPVAAAIAPIFSVTTYAPEHIEAEVRFRVPSASESVAQDLDTSLHNLREDLEDAGFHTAVDVTVIGAPLMMVWKLALLSDPTKEDPLSMRRGLQLVAYAVESTRIGEHMMDPSEDWPPRTRARS